MGDLAIAAGTSQQQIDRLEKSRRRLTVEWMEKLSRALQCDVADLIQEENRDFSLTSKAKVVGSVKQDGKIEWLPAKDAYPIIFGRPKELPGSRMFAVYVSEGEVKGYPEGSELIFCELDGEADRSKIKSRLYICEGKSKKSGGGYSIETSPGRKPEKIKAVLVKSIVNE